MWNRASLRSRGQYDAAAKALEASLTEGYGDETRERLSFELVSILAYQVRDSGRACEALRRHVAAFGATRYADALEQVRGQTACPEGP